MVTFRSQVLSGLRWGVGTRLLRQVFTWTITVVVIRILSPSDYGLLAMANAFVAFLGMMAQLGADSAVVQAAAIDESQVRQMFGFTILVNLALFATTFGAAPLIAQFFDEPRLVALVRALSVQFVLMIFTVIPSAQLARRLDYRRLSLVELAAAMTASVTTLLLALAGYGAWALVGGSLALASCTAVGLNVLSPYWKRPDFRFGGIRRLVSFGGNVTAANILWFVYSQSDVVIAGKLLGNELLGVYAVSMNIASLPASRISAIANSVSFPAFARLQAERERYAVNFLLAVRLLSFAMFPVLWGISSIAPELVRVVLGRRWLSAVVPLQLLAFIMPVHMLAPFMNTAAQGIGRADIALKQVLLASLIMPVAFLTGSHWGVTGLAAAWVLAFPVVFVLALRLFLPVIGLGVRDVPLAMARPVVTSLGMYAAVTLVRVLLTSDLNDVAALTASMVVGIVAYACGTLLFNRSGYREALALLRG